VIDNLMLFRKDHRSKAAGLNEKTGDHF